MRSLILGAVLFSCACGDDSGTRRLPLAPTATPAPLPPVTLVFTDPQSGLVTSDVHEAQDQKLQFNSAGQVLWHADGGLYQFSLRGPDGGLLVKFATKNGERRAYYVYDMDWYHYGPPEIVVDLEVVEGKLVVANTEPPVPLPGS